MPRNEGNIVTEGPELLHDRFYQGGVVSAGEIRATNRALEQDVPNLRNAGRFVKKDNVPGGVARTMFDDKLLSSKTNMIILLQPAVWLKSLNPLHTRHFAPRRELIYPESVLFMRPLNGNSKA